MMNKQTILILTACLVVQVSLRAFSSCRSPDRSLNNDPSSPPKLLLISFDGFRFDYLQNHDLIGFQQLMRSGVYCRVQPSFTSLTFPNHYSIVTGMDQQSHGIVGNRMYDKFLKKKFSMSCCNEDNRWWQQNPNTLPIWMANQRQGGRRSSGAVGFVGSLSPICGRYIDRVLEYTDDRTEKEIVGNITEWFSDSEKPINFGAIYFNEPDKTGHTYGPRTNEMASKLQDMDRLMMYIKLELVKIGQWDDLNVIITTDHGMVEVDPMKSLILDQHIDLSSCIVATSLTLVNLYSESLETVLELKANLTDIPNFSVYLRHEIPARYKYNDNIRIGDVVIIPDAGYLVYMNNEDREKSTIRGGHGFDNTLDEMMGIMIGRGPAFVKTGYSPMQINITDIYPMMLKALGLEQREVDGRFENVRSFMR